MPEWRDHTRNESWRLHHFGPLDVTRPRLTIGYLVSRTAVAVAFCVVGVLVIVAVS